MRLADQRVATDSLQRKVCCCWLSQQCFQAKSRHCRARWAVAPDFFNGRLIGRPVKKKVGSFSVPMPQTSLAVPGGATRDPYDSQYPHTRYIRWRRSQLITGLLQWRWTCRIATDRPANMLATSIGRLPSRNLAANRSKPLNPTAIIRQAA